MAEEDEPTKETGNKYPEKRKNPGEHRTPENRKGGYFSWRQWSRGLNIAERIKESKSEIYPLDRYTNIKVTGDPGQGHSCVCIKELSKAL